MSSSPGDEVGLHTPIPPSRVAMMRHEVATVISAVIHPLVFPLVTVLVIGMTFTHNNIGRTLLFIALAVALSVLPVSLIVLIQVRRGKWSDFDVSQRRQRYALYPISLVSVILLAGVYAALRAPRQLIVATLALTSANLVDGVINLFWKVSAHATTAACCAALLWEFSPHASWGPPSTVGALLVGWSRVELKRHTTGQVIAGWFVGATSALLAIALGMRA